ncbi:MAG: 2-amino-4-hydroxy-6-hydroxymethyldihydropteridine diphosphokinase [Firmicutes bacterium HGW-Firmicutes-13]|nr:MAG: 2-amino-4-hydroxy-6-hydroxymethyldihydropteridine diphosphokinase [Firmicutes bacterium HGW-Firmicutes-13]
MKLAYLGLGSNLGDRISYLNKAVDILNSHEHISVIKVSSFYETDPVGYEEQGKFMNCVVLCETELSPYELLKYIQKIEITLKRVRTIRWGPRTIDVDILMYGDLEINDEPHLVIPHLRMTEREFVLTPLAEIAPEAVHPSTGSTAAELLKKLKNRT